MNGEGIEVATARRWQRVAWCGVFAGLSLLSAASHAEGEAPPAASADAQRWLQRIHQATRKLSFSGVMVYQRAEHSETSRIARLVRAGMTEERLEALDGVPREVIRRGDEVISYLPASQTVKRDRSQPVGTFPTVLPASLSELEENYEVRAGKQERVAGFDCQVIELVPRDQLRYGYRMWADVASGMLIKSRVFNERHESVEQFYFSELMIGPVSRDKLRSRFETRAREWKVQESAASASRLEEEGWQVPSQLSGFRKRTELKRRLGGMVSVRHVVMSDGLAAISVFIEPDTPANQTPLGAARQGVVGLYSRQISGYRVTAMGEAPLESLRLIANSVEYRRPSP
jgi:sigma-E factor negative regulatory protein RseB